MKKTTLLLLLVTLAFSWNGYGQGIETFNAITGNSGSYLSRNWTGDDGSTWTATNARTSEDINGDAITLNDDKANTFVQSGTISQGIGNITISTQRKFSGGSSVLSVFINDVKVGTVPVETAVTTTTISNVNISGNIVIKLWNDTGGSNNGGSDRVGIDDVTWTTYSVLPVELIGLSGQTYEKKNELTWTTVSEINNDYFTIEKSLDGMHYNKIGSVQGNGNSTSMIDYSFNDFEINTTLVYYKLTQVDFDGTKEDVGVIKVTRELNTIFSYPNPASDELNFSFNTNYEGDIIIEYIDIQGKSISENVTVNSNSSFKSTVFQTLSSGLYFTRISENGTIIQSMKIVKL